VCLETHFYGLYHSRMSVCVLFGSASGFIVFFGDYSYTKCQFLRVFLLLHAA